VVQICHAFHDGSKEAEERMNARFMERAAKQKEPIRIPGAA
jgi:hypothetical protein